MSRRLARLLAAAACRLMPSRRREWAEAMARELEHVDGRGAALRFAAGAFGCALGERLRSVAHDPVAAGTAAAAFAVGVGLLLMLTAGAPARMPLVNGLTLILALAAFPLARRLAGAALAHPGRAALACAAVLGLTAGFGQAADGVSRWIAAGPIALQPSLVLLPLLAAAAARSSSPLVAAAVAAAAAALALQPDRAMAAALFALLVAAGAGEGGRWRLAALACAAAGAAAAFLQPDPMQAVTFVDRILPFAARESLALALLAGAGMAMLPLPFLLAADRRLGAALATLWAAIGVAALTGNYPSPLVGYGASAILGYALSLALIAADRQAPARAAQPGRGRAKGGRRGAAEDQKRKAVPT